MGEPRAVQFNEEYIVTFSKRFKNKSFKPFSVLKKKKNDGLFEIVTKFNCKGYLHKLACLKIT